MDFKNFKAGSYKQGYKYRYLQKILIETTNYQRNRVFVFDEYVKMF